METLHLEFDIEVEEHIIETLRKTPTDLQKVLKERMRQVVIQYLQVQEAPDQQDPWLEFLDGLHEYAVDTGIEDFSLNHEHYLYGGPKRS